MKEQLVGAWNDANAWHKEANDFTHKYKGFSPVKVVEEALFLELQPTSVVIRNYQTVDVPKEVEIRVYPRRKPASSEQVAVAYEEALSDAGIPHDVSDRISLDSEWRKRVLWMVVKNGKEVWEEGVPTVLRERKPRFPHPRLIGALYSTLYNKPTRGKDGFGP